MAPEELARRMARLEAKIDTLEEKWDDKLDDLIARDDQLQERINLLILSAAGAIFSLTVMLMVLFFTHLIS